MKKKVKDLRAELQLSVMKVVMKRYFTDQLEDIGQLVLDLTDFIEREVKNEKEKI